jgi:hypothetical protein
MNHTGLTSQCSTCHSGSYVSENAQTWPGASHQGGNPPAQCDTCHKSTTTWATATVDHSKFTPAVVIGGHTCSTCHKSGGTGLPMPTNHIPTTGYCDNCHTNFTAFKPATMNHTGTAGQCSTCHSGAYVAIGTQGALAKPATHIATTAQCDVCHTTTAWKPATFAHDATTVGKCSTCHNGTTALGKGSTHIPTTAQCDTCHTSTTSFTVRTMNHTGLAGQCATCHSGGYVSENAQAKSATHLATTQSCDVCHSTTAWKPATFSHTGVAAGTCATCHGSTATSKPTVHIPTTQSCDVCHKTIAWLPLLTPYAHTGVAVGTCATCHIATYPSMDVKPAAHIPTTAACDGCHRTSAWLPLVTPYSHTGVAAGTCTTCHTSPYTSITLITSNHIPTTAVTASWSTCDACHKNYTSFSGVTLHKTVFTSASQHAGTCPICHEYGNPYGLQGRTPNKHTTTARKAPNSCDNSGCHSVSTFNK